MDKDVDKISFRVKWSFDTDDRDGKLFRYLESLGSSRQSAVLNSLRVYYYPEVAFLDGEPDEESVRLARAAIMDLETRAEYFRRLLGEVSLASLPASRLAHSTMGALPSIQEARRGVAVKQSVARVPRVEGTAEPFMGVPPVEPTEQEALKKPDSFLADTTGSATSLPEIAEGDDWDRDEDEELDNPYDDDL